MSDKVSILHIATLLIFLSGIVLIPLALWNGTLTFVEIKFLITRNIIIITAVLILLDFLSVGKITFPAEPLLLTTLPLIAYTTIICRVNPFTDWLVFGDFCLSLLLFFEAVVLFQNRKYLRKFLLVWQITTIPVCIYHLFQLAGFDVIDWVVPGFAGSTFANRNALTYYLLCSYPFALYLAETSKGKVSFFHLISPCISIVTLLLSRGRAAKIIIPMTLPFILNYLRTRSSRQTLKKTLSLLTVITGSVISLCLIGAIIYAISLSYEQLNAFSHSRLQTWKEAMPLVSENVVFGQGAGVFPRLFPAFQSVNIGLQFGSKNPVFNSHNETLELIVEYGIVGLLLISIFIIGALGLRKPLPESKNEKHSLLFFSACSLAGSFLLSQLVSTSHFLYCSYFSWLSLAILYSCRLQSTGIIIIRKKRLKYTLTVITGAGSAAAVFLLVVYIKLFTADFFTRKASRIIECGGNPDQASTHIATALSLHPENIYARYQRAYLAMCKGNEQRAMADYKAILSVTPYFENIHYNIGIIHYRNGNYKKAIPLLKITVRLYPTQPDGIHYLAKSYYGASLYQESLHWCRLLVRMNPDQKEYLNLFNVVSRMVNNES